MYIINIIFAIFALISLHSMQMFIKSKDGELRKRLIVFFGALGWCAGTWAVVYPPANLLSATTFGLISMVPVTLAIIWLHAHMWKLYGMGKNKRK